MLRYFPALLGNYDRPTDQHTDMEVHKEVTLLNNSNDKSCVSDNFSKSFSAWNFDVSGNKITTKKVTKEAD